MQKYAYWAMDAYIIALFLYLRNFDSLQTQIFIIFIVKYDFFVFTLTLPLRKKLRISADSSLIRQK